MMADGRWMIGLRLDPRWEIENPCHTDQNSQNLSGLLPNGQPVNEPLESAQIPSTIKSHRKEGLENCRMVPWCPVLICTKSEDLSF
jgi:hypothetical protein